MAIRSILLHLTHDKDHRARMTVAFQLARRFHAQLRCVYTNLPLWMEGAPVEGRGASIEFLNEMAEMAEAHQSEIKAEILRACEDHGIPLNWSADEGPMQEVLTAQSHCADLVLVSRAPPRTLEARVKQETPQFLPLKAGCPTLILPDGAAEDMAVGRRVVVAWQYSRNCARTVREALPVLATADQVILGHVVPHMPADSPLDAVREHLARHGVTVEERLLSERFGRSRADLILGLCAEEGADLLVMGAWGQSRLQEMILGSDTGQVLNETPIPVFMDH